MSDNESNGRNPDRFAEPTVSSRRIFEGKIIRLQVDEVRLPNGNTATREIVRHPGAVGIIAVADGKLLLVEQYRKPLERLQLEIPAGKLDPGERPEEAAIRELREETGYTCEKVVHLHSVATSPGFADEVIHLYVAQHLRSGEARPDDDEFLDVRALTLEETLEAVARGAICDAKTTLAVYAWQHFLLTGKWGL